MNTNPESSSSAPQASKAWEETNQEIYLRHKLDEKSNEGRLGMPQGPCQCDICATPEPGEQAKSLEEKDAASKHVDSPRQKAIPLRSRWIRTADQKPTRQDCPPFGYVIERWEDGGADYVPCESVTAPYWMPLPDLNERLILSEHGSSSSASGVSSSQVPAATPSLPGQESGALRLLKLIHSNWNNGSLRIPGIYISMIEDVIAAAGQEEGEWRVEKTADGMHVFHGLKRVFSFAPANAFETLELEDFIAEINASLREKEEAKADAIEELFRIIQELAPAASDTRNRAHKIALDALGEDHPNNRSLVVEIAKTWRGHDGVNWEASTTRDLLLLIRDAVQQKGQRLAAGKEAQTGKTLGEPEADVNAGRVAIQKVLSAFRNELVCCAVQQTTMLRDAEANGQHFAACAAEIRREVWLRASDLALEWATVPSRWKSDGASGASLPESRSLSSHAPKSEEGKTEDLGKPEA